MDGELLRVNDLRTYFYGEQGIAKAIDGISFSLGSGDSLGIVGESGCGKTVTALSIIRLVPRPAGRIESGEILFNGDRILDLPKAEMRKIRGNKISMIFQEPMTSLNPVFRIGEQISEVIRLHQGFSKKEAFDKSVEMLQLVGIPSPEKRVRDYPHQMSGGMRQRAMIAMAMSCRPKLLIADEPTTSLDVTIQAQILDLVQKLKEETGTSIILITHDMAVIAEMAQKIIVMYTGKIMERASCEDLFENPFHPYTKSLLKSIPRLDQVGERKKLYMIPGVVPSLLNVPEGCRFNDRCEKSFSKCAEEEPSEFEVSSGHNCRCWLYA